MAQFVSKLASSAALGSAIQEGYIPRGFRLIETVEKTTAERTVAILLDKIADRPYATEIPIESLESIPIAPPVTNLKELCLAIVTNSGVTATGNPDGFKLHRNDIWKKYSIGNLNSMTETKWDVRHGGYNYMYMLENPNYGVPLDACRQLEKEGVFAKLYPYFYTTPGCNGLISVMTRLGQEMVADMKANKVDIVLLVST